MHLAFFLTYLSDVVSSDVSFGPDYTLVFRVLWQINRLSSYDHDTLKGFLLILRNFSLAEDKVLVSR